MDSHSEATTVNSEINSYSVDFDKIRCMADEIRNLLGIPHYELAITFVDAEEIQVLNREYRGKDQSTDVLSFPQCEWEKPLRVGAVSTKAMHEETPPEILGDIVISLPDAEKNAQNIGQGLDREVAFLLVHGILHLCGHDHMQADEEKNMLAEQEQLMNLLNAKTPAPWLDCVQARSES